MFKLGAKEAADRIRGVFFSDRSARVDPEQAHQMKFVKGVARELGAEETPETISHIAQLLREHDIELHAGHEFPKYATRDWDGTQKIVQNAEEEKQWVEEARPDPADAPRALGRTLDGPVQDLSVDLRRNVPHMADDAPPPPQTPRIPSAVTNREAAQDAHARQPVEDQDRRLAAEAHVEDLAPGGNHQHGGAPYAEPADVGVMAHDDPDRDGIVGQDDNPTHDALLGTQHPQHRSGDSSAGKTDTAPRPVGVSNEGRLRGDDEPGMAAMHPEPTAPRKPIGTRRPE